MTVAIYVLVAGMIALLFIYRLHIRVLRDMHEEKSKEAFDLKMDLDKKTIESNQASIKKDEYFSLLERLEKQRDQWKDMWRTQVGEHQVAQALLEKNLTSVRQTLIKSIAENNMHRKGKNLPEIKHAIDLDAPPVGLAKAFGEEMKALEAEATKDVEVPRTNE